MKESKEIIRASKDSTSGVLINYNVPQKRCWALAVSQLQKYMARHIDWIQADPDEIRQIIPLNKNCEFEICFQLSEIEQDHPGRSYKEIMNLLNIRLVHFVNEQDFEGSSIFNSIKREKGLVTATLPIRSLRWILDFGQKRMFVAFHKPSFLRLTTNYSMDMFLFLSENYGRCLFKIKIEDFKKRIGCPEGYDAQAIKRNIFVPSINEFKTKKTILSFDYAFMTDEDKPNSPGRKRLNVIVIGIKKLQDDGEYKPVDQEKWNKIVKEITNE